MSKLAIVLLALVAVVHAQVNNQHNINIGAIGPQDRLIFSDIVTSIALPLVVRSTDVVFPDAGDVNNAVITAIVIQDNVGNGNGGFPTIRFGGLGQRHVSIRLTSQRGKRTGFTILVFGRP